MTRAQPQFDARTVVQHAHEFGRVAVMLGGRSSERAVSLDTGNAVLAALRARDIDAHAWDPAEKSMAEFAMAGFDRVWIALHGPGGEDGALQGALQWFDIPYTGSGVMSSVMTDRYPASRATSSIARPPDITACAIPKPSSR